VLAIRREFESKVAGQVCAKETESEVSEPMLRVARSLGVPMFFQPTAPNGSAPPSEADLDRAISGYTEMIRLDPARVEAYVGRGTAWHAKGDQDAAIADYNEAIRLDPKAAAYHNRGLAYYAKGDRDRAIADYGEAINLDPKSSGAYFSRGRANLYAGSLPRALADLNQASELAPKSPYAALWLDIANKRSNLASRLPQAIAQIDMTKWPAPVIRLYLGQLTPAAVLAAADDPDANIRKGQICETHFYSGELALQQGAEDEAARLFRLAASDCPKIFIEWEGANAELKAQRRE
jgi:lipoprotein NlpI